LDSEMQASMNYINNGLRHRVKLIRHPSCLGDGIRSILDAMIEDARPTFGTACVLAGGRGRRMEGRDKLHIEFAGQRLLARIATSLRTRFDDLVAISSRTEAFDGLGYRVVPDEIPDGGPLVGLLTALKHSASDWVYLVACDMPFFAPDWVDRLSADIDASVAAGRHPVAAAARSGPFFEPFHAFYHVDLAGYIEVALGAGTKPPSIQSVLRPHEMVLIDNVERYSEGQRLFVNLNTPDDIIEAERISGI